MKKMFLTALVALLMLPMMAQTDFRHLNYEEALTAAKAEKKLLFIDFYTTWCLPCKKMTKEVFPDKTLGDFMNQTFVSIKLDAEKEGKQLADLHKVQAFPTFVVVDAEGKEVMRSVGYKQAPEFLADLQRLLNPEKSLAKLEEAYKKGERTPQLIQDYATSIMDGANDREAWAEVAQKAYDIVQDYFKNLSETDRLKEENFFIYRTYSAILNSPSAKFMAQNLNRFPKNVQPEFRAMIEKLYENEFYAYFTASTEMKREKLEALKQEIQTANLDPQQNFALPNKFIDCYLEGNKSKYLDFCKKNFKKLSTKQQGLLVNGFLRLFYKESKDLKRKAALFLRSQLAEMETNTMYYAVLQITEMEK